MVNVNKRSVRIVENIGQVVILEATVLLTLHTGTNFRNVALRSAVKMIITLRMSSDGYQVAFAGP